MSGALYLEEAVVERLLTPAEVTGALEQAFRALAEGEADQRPRVRARLGRYVLHNLPAVSGPDGMAGLKSYLSGPAGVRFVTLLFDLERCELAAVVESARLGQLRTGCATALACRYLAPGHRRLALMGTGTVARGQLEALLAERTLEEVRVWSPRPESRRAFQRWAEKRLGVECQICSSPAEAAEGVDIVVTATSAREPFLEASMLAPVRHVSAVGSNWARRREVASRVVEESDLVVVDDPEQARLEAGDLLLAEGLDWSRVRSLAQVVREGAGPLPPRTFFKSLGVGIEDVAAAALALRKAREEGLGRRLGSS